MNRESAFNTLSEDWASITGGFPKTDIEELKQDHIPFLRESKPGINAAALTIVDINAHRYLYVDQDIELITGFPLEAYQNNNLKRTFLWASLDHIPGLISSTLHQRRFFAQRKPENYNQYIVNREFSYLGKDRVRRWVLHQVIRHFLNPEGKIAALAVLQTKIDHLKLDNRFRYYIYHRDSNQIVHPSANSKPSGPIALLTDREQNILNLILSGFDNKAIAEQLHISYHTVRTHRKNILRKTNCKNVVDLFRLSNGLQ